MKLDKLSSPESTIAKLTTFRNKVADLEKKGYDENLWMSDEEQKKTNPLKHTFTDGCYIREIFTPAGQIIVTKIHKKDHPFFLMKGELSILTEDGVVNLNAPYQGITKVGTKRVIYTHTDCIFTTVHATDKLTVDEVEEDVIAKDFSDPLITAREFELLTNKK